MSFREMLDNDISSVFLNTNEFAELCTIIYNKETFRDIPAMFTDDSQQPRRRIQGEKIGLDHVQGLYTSAAELFCKASDLHDVQPERGTLLRINRGQGFRRYTVAYSSVEGGMFRVGLEAVSE